MQKLENSKFNKTIGARFSPILIAIAMLCSISLLTRLALSIASFRKVDWSVINIIKIFAIGLFYDLAAASFAIIPLVIYLWLVPTRFYRSKTNKILLFIYFFIIIITLIFNAVSEWFFWDEFSVRYNFIAVDYLVYTTEVIGNIRQSYPINTIILVMVAITAGLLFLLRKLIWPTQFADKHFKKRSLYALLLLLIPLTVYFGVSHKWKFFSNNQYTNELSGNGMYDFGFAFWNNQLDYNTFYKTLPILQVENIIRNIFKDTTGKGLATDRYTSKMILHTQAEKRMNVVLISVESLSADFLESFGNQQHITPELDSLAKKGLLFTNLYASGTRTVRGLEALSLCIPPTPGQSIVKRPDNKNLFTLGSVFRSKGYSSRFIYGGYGYFDNMTEFFSNNGYTVTDRSALKDAEIHYSNIWGVADEDLFTLSMHELDKDYQNKKPFFAQIMTVSNHRPYTYPEGRIDIPSKTSREGAVKYTDYAIGKFLKEARKKLWFSNTLFVVVADHCASSAGKVELPVDRYHIPMIFYSPGHIVPSKFEKLTAQLDIGPTILSYLNMGYKSKFFGHDVFTMQDSAQRAFISTYQSLGYIRNNKLVILNPNKKVSTYKPDFKTGNSVKVANDNKLTNEAISYYQLASYLYQKKLYQQIQ
ncbi:LTA synthase family protein [Pedobacter sp. Leaf132]|uniref:LTA synthase family protein n=1 Tax=Pedobacter sp. Leaf132 TaxID=2876557 RepID=UPI001E34EBC7|nr:LTA synthase family protein [Pedobacter sp. Leaf132]